MVQRFSPFFALGEISGGPLLVASLIALVAVNSPWGGAFEAIWDGVLRLSYADLEIGMSLAKWINDGLMPLFFLIIGTEVKREFVKGSLSSLKSAVLPLAGAIGGLVIPIACFLAINFGQSTSHGWGIVAAMDTAFSLAIVGVFGTRLPVTVRGILLGFAAIDDVFGLLIIAFAYTPTFHPWYLGVAAGAFAGILGLQRLRWVSSPPYVVLGILVWIGVLGSGVHPTIAGVAVGLLLPTTSRLSERRFVERVQRPIDKVKEAAMAASEADDASEADAHCRQAQRGLGYIHEMAAATDEAASRLIRVLTPWVSYVVLPLFALSNIRVRFAPELLADAWQAPLAAGIIVGLAIGKPVGFLFFTWLAVRLRLAVLPEAMTWTAMAGISGVAGIGFTLSFFIAELAFSDQVQSEVAGLAIFSASLLAAFAGFGLFSLAARKEA
ncbi:Na+/H+ antiporter NhaA [Novosphingobium sp. TCA1]|uniref:Na+/H+ antiporter NhaA n=1 Tax=Novosphingobium sp. TCA1 TaxID=2682474 RepID=UPI001F330C55|nr:Na+/H+ antiporter NhaA [Novosphingobium sp. TCA1]